MEGRADLMIMTNWCHGTSPDELARTIQRFNGALPFSRLLIDTVRPGAMTDVFHHTVADLERLGQIELTVDGGDGVRDLHVIAMPASA